MNMHQIFDEPRIKKNVGNLKKCLKVKTLMLMNVQFKSLVKLLNLINFVFNFVFYFHYKLNTSTDSLQTAFANFSSDFIVLVHLQIPEN